MTGEEMTAALHALGDALEAEGTTGRIFLVGGAVMVLAFQTRESSDDLDAAVVPNEAVLRVARAVGRRRGLQPDWLSEAAAIFIPIAKEPDWQPTGTYGTLEVLRADEATMLAMKLRASRASEIEGTSSTWSSAVSSPRRTRCWLSTRSTSPRILFRLGPGR